MPHFVDLGDQDARRFRRRVDPVVVVVEYDRNVQFCTDREEVIDIVTNLGSA